MPDCFDFQSLTRTLLRGGIGPRRVRRIVSELRDHFHDLRTDAEAGGMNDAEATTWASSRLGSEQQVAKETLARPELRSWSARWPWAFYALLPPLLMAALVVLVVLAMEPVFELYVLLSEWEATNADLPHHWFMGAVDGSLTAIKYTAPLLLCAAFCWMAILRLSRSPWLIPGIAVTAFLGGSFDMYISWGTDEWSMSVDLFLYPPYPNPHAHGLRIAANLLLTLVPYLYWLLRHGETRSQLL
ncbi:MAG: hypothetical protein OXC69_07435 [Candidatus Tectomicrobia bacterium]|nr:hypothetical protein [Candidatus Tectomicrobia bacterium]